MKGCWTQSLRPCPALNASCYAYRSRYYMEHKWFSPTQRWVHLMPSVQEMGVNLIEFLWECWGGHPLGLEQMGKTDVTEKMELGCRIRGGGS